MGLALDEHLVERLDAQAVERRRAVEQHRCSWMTSEDVPDLRIIESTIFLAALMSAPPCARRAGP